MLTGAVKMFGAERGYGFLTSAAVEGDIYFQGRFLPHDMMAACTNGIDLRGIPVSFELTRSADGKPQARNISAIGGGIQTAAQAAQAVGAGQHHQGEVKSFYEAKGFGFIQCPTIAVDVYFQKKDVPEHLQGQNFVGMIVDFHNKVTPDGKVQAMNLVFSGTPKPMAEGRYVPGSSDSGRAPDSWMVGMLQSMTEELGPIPPQYQMALQMMMGSGSGGKGGGKGSDQRLGTVKYYNVEKGFGFITSGSVQGDIYFQSAAPVVKGQPISFTLTWTDEGMPQAHDLSVPFEADDQTLGRIRSYNAKTGYGFLVPDERRQDVYFKKSALPEELREAGADDLVGCTMQCNIGLQKDGQPIATQMLLVAAADPAAKRQWEEGPDVSGPIPAAKRPRVLQQQAGAEEKYGGWVRSYHPSQGFGFITPDSFEGDVYFKSDALHVAYQQTELTGVPVRFALSWSPDGKPQAYDLEL